ncbi:hypothetical protein SPFL3101_03477 [Sporomusaceae bacterium FL31]|nr:hypothetical protein SPFL3101_03477 [Sporomusaceae bacterium FL31]
MAACQPVGIKTKRVSTICLFVFMLLLAVSASYYPRQIKERVMFGINLPQPGVQTVIVDFKDMGLPKYLVQPGRFIISAGRNGIRNTSSDVMQIRVRTSGFPGDVKVKTLTHEQKANEDVYLILKPGMGSALTLELNMSRDESDSANLGVATLDFIDEASQQMIGQVAFSFRN